MGYKIGDITWHGVVVESWECMDCLAYKKGGYWPRTGRQGSGKSKRCVMCVELPAYKVVGMLVVKLGLSSDEVRRLPEVIRWWQVHCILKQKIKRNEYSKNS